MSLEAGLCSQMSMRNALLGVLGTKETGESLGGAGGQGGGGGGAAFLRLVSQTFLSSSLWSRE